VIIKQGGVQIKQSKMDEVVWGIEQQKGWDIEKKLLERMQGEAV